ncbi:MAG: zinc ribbon domain-containing protein [Acidobacteriota bacterium]
MPIYEYQCLDCGLTFEKLVSLHTQSMTCSNCQSDHVEKLFSSFAVQSTSSPIHEGTGPCNTCGAPKQGMCRQMN